MVKYTVQRTDETLQLNTYQLKSYVWIQLFFLRVPIYNGMNVKGDKSSYNFLTKASKEMDQSVSGDSFSLFLVKFKKLVFSAPLKLFIH